MLTNLLEQCKKSYQLGASCFILTLAGSWALFLGARPSLANPVTLDFSFNPALAPGAAIPQSYGDIAGQLDMIYSSVAGPGSQVPCFDPGVYFWDADYSNLKDVAYGCDGGTAQVKLAPAPGYLVTLIGFDLGAWQQVDRPSQVAIYSGNISTPIFADPAPLTIAGSAAKHYVFSGPLFTSPEGYVIQFGPDGYNVGIDNLSFAVSPVPGPLPLFGVAASLGFSRVVKKRIKAAGK